MAQRDSGRGFTLVEVVAVMALMGVALGIAMPRPDPTAFALRNAENTLVADLRRTRAEAMTRGVHFRLEIVDVVTHRIVRLREETDDVWVQDGPPIVVRSTPASARLAAEVVGLSFEFDTRGVLVVPAEPVTVTLYQDVTGRVRVIDVWPSGQVTREGSVT